MMSSWNRLIRFTEPGSDAVLIGEPTDPELDVGIASYEGKTFEADIFQGATSILDVDNKGLKKSGVKKVVGKLLSPLSQEEVGTIVGTCIYMRPEVEAHRY
jgi:hypothetical protein